MTQAYSDPTREDDEYALPDVEVFYMDAKECALHNGYQLTDAFTPGWYYWFCFPGCLPDSEPMGPFPTHAESSALRTTRSCSRRSGTLPRARAVCSPSACLGASR